MDGFVDLRRSSQPDSVHDSFWPSFTDVMMVVVMIFIMASLIMVVKNWDLVAELRATIHAEREAREIARNTDATNKTLAEELAEVQHQLSELRMQLMRVREESKMKSRLIDERDEQLIAINEEVRELAGKLESASRERASLDESLVHLQSQHDEKARQLEALADEHGALQAEYRIREDELLELQQLRQQADLLLADLQGDYDDLKVKYDRLVRPARTAKGKYVVEVRYEKRGKYHHIKYKEPDNDSYKAVSRKELDKHLAALKEAHPGKLYIKIIIPSNSGLSYNEAWRFTADVLAKYDYYHQN